MNRSCSKCIYETRFFCAVFLFYGTYRMQCCKLQTAALLCAHYPILLHRYVFLLQILYAMLQVAVDYSFLHANHYFTAPLLFSTPHTLCCKLQSVLLSAQCTILLHRFFCKCTYIHTSTYALLMHYFSFLCMYALFCYTTSLFYANIHN